MDECLTLSRWCYFTSNILIRGYCNKRDARSGALLYINGHCIHFRRSSEPLILNSNLTPLVLHNSYSYPIFLILAYFFNGGNKEGLLY